MSFVLMPHQHKGAAFLSERRFALLGDEPGAGKTAQVVEAVRLTGARSVLVLCPASVKGHWAREFNQVSGRTDITVVEGRPKKLDHAEPGIVITSHAAMTHEPTVDLLRLNWDVVVVDEAHTFRNVEAAGTVFLMGATHKALWHYAHRMWLLTGSPIVNSAADVYPYCASLFSEGHPINYQAFIGHFTEIKPCRFAGQKPTGIQNEYELVHWLRRYMLRRANFLDLPQRSFHTERLRIADADLAPIMAALNGVNPAMIEAIVEHGLEPSAAISRVRHALGLAKAGLAADYINALVRQGRGPVVAFYHHTDVRETISCSLVSNGLRVSCIDGSITGKHRVQTIDAFQNGLLDVLLVQTQAGGTGITLTRSNQAVIVESPWTAIALEQAVARLHRITQERPVTAHVLTSQCWLDDTMARLIVQKAAAAKRLLTDLVS